MAWKLPDGNIINHPKSVEIDDVKYASDIFRRWSKEELNAIGILLFDEVGYDSVWYISTGFEDVEADGTITRTHTTANRFTDLVAKDNQTILIRSQYIANIGRAVNYGDFYDAVSDSDAKKLWTDWETALKNDAKTLKDQVDAAGSYDEIKNLNFAWTTPPDYVPYVGEENPDGPV
jgi:hypothetical protein